MLIALYSIGLVLGSALNVAARLFLGAHSGHGFADPISDLATAVAKATASAKTPTTPGNCVNPGFSDIETFIQQISSFVSVIMLPLGVVGIGSGVIMTQIGYQQGTTTIRTSIVALVFGVFAGVIGATLHGAVKTPGAVTC